MKLHKTLLCVVGWSAMMSLQSCADNDFKEIDSDVIGQTNYNADSEYFDVIAENKVMKGIRTNGLSAYQLGEYSQEPFGKTNASVIAQVSLPSNHPIFGQKSQSSEIKDNYNEQEKVISVKLNIPFFSTVKERKKVEDKTETSYILDSIYGAKNASFDVTVHESKYYLRDIDDNLENPQVYFSNITLESNLIGEELATQSGVKINDNEVVNYKFDDPSTTDKDESKEELDRLAPRLSIALDNTFFQHKIIDKEGSPELSNPNAFKLYFKGIIIKTSHFSKEMLMLLDFSKANIEIVYEYKNKKDGKNYTKKNRVVFPLSGIKVNQFLYENDNVDTASKKNIFLQGGKRFAELTILNKENINKIKNEGWLINDAVLSFKLDKSSPVKDIPERIYIYDAVTGRPLIDYFLDKTNNPKSANSKLIHLGKYNEKTNSYEIHIPNHITEIVRKSSKNVKLAIVVAQNISQETKEIGGRKIVVNHVASIDYLKEDNSKGKTSVTTATTPLSVVLYGSDNSVNEDNRLRLKITYTKPIN